MMQNLAVLDYNTSKVHIFTLPENIEVNEEYIEKMGFNIDECSWMCGQIETIIHDSNFLM